MIVSVSVCWLSRVVCCVVVVVCDVFNIVCYVVYGVDVWCVACVLCLLCVVCGAPWCACTLPFVVVLFVVRVR